MNRFKAAHFEENLQKSTSEAKLLADCEVYKKSIEAQQILNEKVGH